jgi:hypothetical protein
VQWHSSYPYRFPLLSKTWLVRWCKHSCSAAPLGTWLHILCTSSCVGTACADPSNIRSLSLTARPDVAVGILRHHSAAPLGQSLNIIYLP